MNDDFEIKTVRSQPIDFILGTPDGMDYAYLDPSTNEGWPKNPKNVMKWLATLPHLQCEECQAGRCKNSEEWDKIRQAIVDED